MQQAGLTAAAPTESNGLPQHEHFNTYTTNISVAQFLSGSSSEARLYVKRVDDLTGDSVGIAYSATKTTVPGDTGPGETCVKIINRRSSEHVADIIPAAKVYVIRAGDGSVKGYYKYSEMFTPLVGWCGRDGSPKLAYAVGPSPDWYWTKRDSMWHLCRKGDDDTYAKMYKTRDGRAFLTFRSLVLHGLDHRFLILSMLFF